MALITRVSRLFKADMHAVLDRIESPELLLKQAIREMGEALAADRRRFERLDRERRQLANREEIILESLRHIEQELDISFASSDQALTRSVLRRKLEALNGQRLLTTRKQTLDEVLAQQKRLLLENGRRLDDMRHKAEMLSRDPVHERLDGIGAGSGATVSDQEVELALLMELKRRERS